MPAVPTVLAKLIETKIHNYMKTAYPYGGPLAGQITTYYKQFCSAIGGGIVSKSLNKIKWVSKDTGLMGSPPVPGVSIGKGIFVDKEWLNENLYRKLMSVYPNLPPYPPATKTTRWIDPFGIEHENVQEVHPPYPANSDYSNGMFVECITKGIADAIEEHYKKAWILQGNHPIVYLGKGKVLEGNFQGLVAPEIASEIQKLGSSMYGPYWVQLTMAVAEVYVKAIHMHSYSGPLTITGICVPTPIPLQVCALPAAGAGTGDAL